jgi:serine/threonine protein kinase
MSRKPHKATGSESALPANKPASTNGAARSPFLDSLRKSQILTPQELDSWLAAAKREGRLPPTDADIATRMVQQRVLTSFQARQLLAGRYRNFVIQAKYRVLDLLGAGGAGGVFLCEHIGMKRRVALKMIPPGKVNDELLRRFQREAAMGSLVHPNLVHALDCDHDGPLYFLVMEYVDGIDLLRLVTTHGSIDFTRAVNYIAQAAGGLAFAHEAGWIHRDVKPSNLLVDRKGRVRVTDMGVARLMDDTVDELTRQVEDQRGEQTVLGSIDFMSPEQAYDAHDVDVRTDVYGLGATLYFLITGKSPLPPGTLPEKMLQLQRKNPTAVKLLRPDIPPDVESVLYRMMARRPQSRYESPAEVAQALRACRCWAPNVAPPRLPPSREETLYDPTPPVKPASKPSPRVAPATASQLELPPIETAQPPVPRKRNPWLVVGACLAVAAVLGLLAYLALMFNAGRTGAHESDGDAGIRYAQAPVCERTFSICKTPDQSR